MKKEFLLEMMKEELALLRKLMIEYWSGTKEAADGDVDVDSPYEKWADEYAMELIHGGHSPESAAKAVRKAIAEYIRSIYCG